MSQSLIACTLALAITALPLMAEAAPEAETEPAYSVYSAGCKDFTWTVREFESVETACWNATSLREEGRNVFVVRGKAPESWKPRADPFPAECSVYVVGFRSGVQLRASELSTDEAGKLAENLRKDESLVEIVYRPLAEQPEE